MFKFLSRRVLNKKYGVPPDCQIVFRVSNKADLILAAILALLFLTSSSTAARPLVLISEPTSTRAIALESVTSSHEPFALTSAILWGSDRRTRIMFFALNLNLPASGDLSGLTADAEDELHRHYDLKVEYVGAIPGQTWMSAVIVRLNDGVGDVGDVLVRIVNSCQASNRVRVGIGHVGGGPPDDVGSSPTPAPPYLILGRVTVATGGLDGVAVALSGDASAATTTDADGNYSILATVAGDYTLSISKAFYDFSPSSRIFASLSSGRDGVDFTGVRRTYAISGRITDAGTGIKAVTVELDHTGRVTNTDELGNYSFTVPAGFDYRLLISKEDYVFETPSVLLTEIDGDRIVNIQGNPYVFLTGRIIGANGRGVFGIKVDCSGTQAGTTFTNNDGNYSFLVTAFGNYLLRPSKEQDYYIYAPNTVTLTALTDSRVANFTAALNASVIPSYVLEFDGTPKTVDYSIPHFPPDWNLFWPDGLDFGHFFWEFWAMPGDNAGATYMISDGWGGAHAILFGVANLGAREPGRYQLLGNIWNGSYVTYFASDEGPAPQEWGHYAAGWDGNYIVIYFDGVPVGKTAFTGPRITPGGIQGCGRLLIGGSDHSNFSGRIAQVRGYETYNPREDAGMVYASSAPETVFSVDGSLLSYFFRPSENIADLSLYGQYGRQHAGLPHATINGVPFPCAGCPLPEFVIDPTAPDFAHPQAPGQPPAPVDNPGAVPSGALVFDSFSRRNSTYALGGLGGLGSTEGGASGRLAWRTVTASGRQPFGVLNGRVVLLSDTTAISWVPIVSDVADLDIRVDRHPGEWGTGQNTGVSFRVVDANNYFFAYTSEGGDQSQPKSLNLGHYQAGQREVLANVVMPPTWTTLRLVTTDAGAIRVYADNTLVVAMKSDLFSTAKAAGIYNNTSGLALTNRWDNFTILTAAP